MFAARLNAGLRPVPAWVLYPLGALPALWLFWLALTGGLGVDPVKTLERELGLIGLQLIVAGLAVTPLRRFTGVSLVRFRRAIGVLAFAYVALHLAVWVTLDLQFRWAEIGADIVKRPYIMMGMAGFLMLLPLALTSNDRSLRRLGPLRWRRLHRLAYPAALAGGVHYLWLVKAWPVEPMLYLAAMVCLLALRLVPAPRRAA
ncbi:MAG TPA: protein-methionine-sulfoxide reductase heme-binding subunit MsrQ [Paracoccaceae bacterium]|nr:protein-methionine-sulfoxide reductase heme-binding subunit MsrQ [Paracoccaceae bacterium]